MRQESARAREGRGESDFKLRSQFYNCERRRVASVKDMEEIYEVLFHRSFVEGNSDGVGANGAKINAPRFGGFDYLCRAFLSQVHANGIEVHASRDAMAKPLQPLRENSGQQVYSSCDVFEAIRPVINCIERGHVGQERLGGADVA